jgi:uncharacterized protein
VAMQPASNSTQFSGAVWRFSICSCHERNALILSIPKSCFLRGIEVRTQLFNLKGYTSVQNGSQEQCCMDLDSLLSRLEAVYRSVDEQSRRLAEYHGERLRCSRGCCVCCVDEITVFEVEAHCIMHHGAELLAESVPHEEGACAFLDENGDCRIYEARPYVCRTQGLPLRWLDETPDDELVEMRDICPLNDPGPPIEDLPEEACWTIGPVEQSLAELQASLDGGALRRVSLRSLFRKSSG